MQKLFARIAVEIADSAAEKQHENVVAVAASRCNGAQTLKVGLLESNDADQIYLRQLFYTRRQRMRRNSDGVLLSDLPPRKCFENPARLFSRAAAEFRHAHGRRYARHDLGGVFLEQARVRARQSVLWVQADGFEERGADFVVDIFGRKLALAGFREAFAHVGCEFRHVLELQSRHRRLFPGPGPIWG